MKSLVASVATLALLAPAAAQAGTYVGVGIGTGASTDGGLSIFNSDGRHSGRLVVGDRFGIISVEGGLEYFGLGYSRTDWNAVSLGAGAKLHLPILPMFDGYVRLGVEKTRMSSSDGGAASGNGWVGGLGLEYNLPTVSIWADVSKHNLSSFPDVRYDGGATIFTLGVNVGF